MRNAGVTAAVQMPHKPGSRPRRDASPLPIPPSSMRSVRTIMGVTTSHRTPPHFITTRTRRPPGTRMLTQRPPLPAQLSGWHLPAWLPERDSTAPLGACPRPVCLCEAGWLFTAVSRDGTPSGRRSALFRVFFAEAYDGGAP